jgi:UDP-N-acetylmuramoylalanine--D-glutamate ligase
MPAPLTTPTRIDPGDRVLLLGLGHFGGQIAVARYLCSQGAQVTITDRDDAAKLAPSIAQIKDLPITYHLGGHLDSDFTSADLIVTSPAVPPSSRHLQLARERGIPVVTEIELTLERILARNPRQTLVAVTGTKGKSTTTALLGKMLATARTTHVGGNIGAPLINHIDSINPDDFVLLELSSYMLHYLGPRAFRPGVAVVTLISQDHLEWHGGLQNYYAAKRQLISHLRPGDTAVLYNTSPTFEEFAATATTAGASVIPYGPNLNHHPIPLLLPGVHNQTNAQGALAAAGALGVPRTQAANAVATFPGLPHRLFLVAERNGVRYYDDSIATIPDAAVAALESFPANTVLHIVGGYDKHLDNTPLVRAIQSHAKAALCIGATGPALANAIGQKAHLAQSLDEAIKTAQQLASKGDTVLLSPGTASYDQYPNFEARGNHFAQLVCEEKQN